LKIVGVWRTLVILAAAVALASLTASDLAAPDTTNAPRTRRRALNQAIGRASAARERQ
jgi:hypothetical protein